MALVEDVDDYRAVEGFIGDLKRSGWWEDAMDFDHRMLEGIATNAIPGDLVDDYVKMNERFRAEGAVIDLMAAPATTERPGVADTMLQPGGGDTVSACEQAAARIAATPELEAYREIILEAEPESENHFEWVAGCSQDELVCWAEMQIGMQKYAEMYDDVDSATEAHLASLNEAELKMCIFPHELHDEYVPFSRATEAQHRERAARLRALAPLCRENAQWHVQAAEIKNLPET
jgi:hypothetical protein